MSNKIPQEDIDLINHLMKERRDNLYQRGPESKNFIEINLETETGYMLLDLIVFLHTKH